MATRKDQNPQPRWSVRIVVGTDRYETRYVCFSPVDVTARTAELTRAGHTVDVLAWTPVLI